MKKDLSPVIATIIFIALITAIVGVVYGYFDPQLKTIDNQCDYDFIVKYDNTCVRFLTIRKTEHIQFNFSILRERETTYNNPDGSMVCKPIEENKTKCSPEILYKYSYFVGLSINNNTYDSLLSSNKRLNSTYFENIRAVSVEKITIYRRQDLWNSMPFLENGRYPSYDIEVFK